MNIFAKIEALSIPIITLSETQIQWCSCNLGKQAGILQCHYISRYESELKLIMKLLWPSHVLWCSAACKWPPDKESWIRTCELRVEDAKLRKEPINYMLPCIDGSIRQQHLSQTHLTCLCSIYSLLLGLVVQWFNYMVGLPINIPSSSSFIVGMWCDLACLNLARKGIGLDSWE